MPVFSLASFKKPSRGVIKDYQYPFPEATTKNIDQIQILLFSFIHAFLYHLTQD